MMNSKTTQTHAQAQHAEALRYAFLLDWSSRLGVLALLLSFALYVSGLLTPHVPLDQLPSLWNLSASDYLQRTASPTGWGWLALAHRGDYSNLIGIALLSGCSVAPLLGVLALYFQRKDFVYASICATILLVLLLAASGVLTAGH
ncbi:MAG: hypothetical protein FD135_4076 [Comamonadaceae bacterium]|nr:MAG: hypothetical protein FD135_4076 [Comamonadaceae bacterium]